MYDFVFNPDKEQLALMQYRERHDYALRPEGEKGVPVIRKLPTGPHRLAKIAPYEKWGKIKNRTIRDTVDVYLEWSSVRARRTAAAIISDAGSNAMLDAHAT
jgi:hypothetical protein